MKRVATNTFQQFLTKKTKQVDHSCSISHFTGSCMCECFFTHEINPQRETFCLRGSGKIIMQLMGDVLIVIKTIFIFGKTLEYFKGDFF